MRKFTRPVSAVFEPDIHAELVRLSRTSGGSLSIVVRELVMLGLRVQFFRDECRKNQHEYELEVVHAPHQKRIVPERQLAELKAGHWKILADYFDKVISEYRARREAA